MKRSERWVLLLVLVLACLAVCHRTHGDGAGQAINHWEYE